MSSMEEVTLSVSDFVAVLNQSLEYAFPSVMVQGELANFRVSKNRWVYFDLKDEYASVKFFGTVYQLPGPLEDGMLLQVRGLPRLHQLYGFSVNVQFMQPVGEGSLKRAAALLEAKLAAEGLFDENRKRPLPYPPQKIGLITSGESAAYHDFIKIMNERWGGLEIFLADVQVQGEAAPGQIVAALDYFNLHQEVDVIVVTRGGGSAEDLAAFSTERVTRAVAASRTPTLVAIGHEIDISLAELAADRRASTPSNAAQMLTPDRLQLLQGISSAGIRLGNALGENVTHKRRQLESSTASLHDAVGRAVKDQQDALRLKRQVLSALSPQAALSRGYGLIRHNGKLLRSVTETDIGATITVTVRDGTLTAKITKKGGI